VRLIDITPAVSPALEGWPGDTRFEAVPRWSQARGDSCTVARVTLSTHLGAHADAPRHYRRDGADAAALPLERYAGPARVIQCPGIKAIGPREAALAAGAERALYRVLPEGTGPGWTSAFAALTLEGARALVAFGLKLFGTDAPSIDPADSQTLEAHHALDRGGVAILEGLALAGVPAGEYDLIAFPLKWLDVDAAPVRAVLRVREQGVPS
jgi:arylformamidase